MTMRRVLFGILLVLGTVLSDNTTSVLSTLAPASNTSETSENTLAPSSTTLAPDVTLPVGTSTIAPASSTVAVSTNSPASTTPATLPNVPVNHVEFAFSSCDDTQCTYHFDAPKNDQTFLATEVSVIATDQTQFDSIHKIVNTKDAAVEKANNDANERVQHLLDQLKAIQENLDIISASIKNITSQQQDASNNLQFVESYIDSVNNRPSSCYYKCLIDTTPAPPTTTPTPPPTTTPSPCATYKCPGNSTDNCQLDAFNEPYCTNCIGNQAGENCAEIACSPSGTNFVFDSTASQTTLYSCGYDSTNANASVIPAEKNCQWNLNGTSFKVSTGFTLQCVQQGVTLNLITDDFTSALTSSMKLWQINAMFEEVKNARIVLTSGAAVSSYCQLPLSINTDSESSFSRKITSPQKSGGFFGWLLGY